MNNDMIPLLTVALLVWAGVYAFLWSVDRKVRALERRVRERDETTGASSLSVRYDGDAAREKETINR